MPWHIVFSYICLDIVGVHATRNTCPQSRKQRLNVLDRMSVAIARRTPTCFS